MATDVEEALEGPSISLGRPICIRTKGRRPLLNVRKGQNKKSVSK
jgi:hypothetical protein